MAEYFMALSDDQHRVVALFLAPADLRAVQQAYPDGQVYRMELARCGSWRVAPSDRRFALCQLDSAWNLDVLEDFNRLASLTIEARYVPFLARGELFEIIELPKSQLAKSKRFNAPRTYEHYACALIRKVGFFRLASWTHLTKFVLERLKWVHDFSSVGDLDGLQVLHIRDCKISVGNQRPCFLARLSQHLHALSLRGSVIDSIEMVELSTALARYDQLEHLDLSHVKIVSVIHDLNWPIVSFESLSRLRDVVLIVVHEKYSWGSMPRLTPDCLDLLPMGMLEQLRSLQIQMDLHSPACCLNTLSRCISLRVLKLEVAHSCAKPLDLVVIAALPTNLSKLSITTHDDVENFGRRNPDYSIIPRQKTPRSVVSSARRLELTCGMLTDDVARACSHVEVFKVRKARRPSGSKVRIPVLAEVELVLAMPRLRKLEMDHPVILTGDPHAIGTLFRRLVAFGGDVCETTEVLELGALPTRECCVQGNTMLSIVQAMWWLEELDLWRIESIEPSDLRLLLRNMSRLRKLVLSRRVSCEELHTHREDFPLLTTLLHPSEDCWWMAEHSAYKKPSTLG